MTEFYKIRAELRNWWIDKEGNYHGQIYDDVDCKVTDGEEFVVLAKSKVEFIVQATFYVLRTKKRNYHINYLLIKDQRNKEKG